MSRSPLSTPVIVAVCLALFSPGAAGQVIQWTDENGELHFSDSMQAVPEKFRPKVIRDEAAAKAPGPGNKDKMESAGKDAKADSGKASDTRPPFADLPKGGKASGGSHDDPAWRRARVQGLEDQIRHLRNEITRKQRLMNISKGTGAVYVNIPEERRREIQAEIDHLNSRITEIERQIREVQNEIR